MRISSSPPLPLYRTADIRSIEARYLPDAVPPLMERAGAAAAQVALDILAERPGPVLVAAGPGNNGGDAFVLARILKEMGKEVLVAFAGDASRLPEDAAQAVMAFGAAGGEPTSELPEGNDFALAVDGIFGIGLTRPVEGRYAAWIERLNGLSCPMLAIDIPSGLDADTGRVWGTAVRASHTATFIAAKPGLFTLDGPDYAGHVSVHDLDLEPMARPAMGRIVAPALFSRFLLPRRRNSHKGSYGSAGVLGGAAGMVGAALMCGRAALQIGAGRVFVGLLRTAALPVDPVQPELMLREAHALLDAGQCTCLAAGPGLGTAEAAYHLLFKAAATGLPLLLDADALNLAAQDSAVANHVARRGAPTLATPHPAEAARLLGCSTAQVQTDRIRSAQEVARHLKAWTVLKGCGSVLAAPDGRWWINTSGNPGMASAGMGDVLSGLALGLLSQGWHAEEALLAAVHLHGAAADACVLAGQGPAGLCATEVIPAARRLFNDWIAAGG